jgi:hypothetical protein
MPSYYYLISSLSILVLGEKPPLSLEKFMDSCSTWLSDSKYKILQDTSLLPDFEQISKNKVVNRWKNWETCLRNRMIIARARDLNKDATSYIQEERDYFSEIEREAQEAYSANNPLAKEKILDEIRWKALDNLECGHLFDIEMLCIYKLRLMLCEKWITRKREMGEKNLDAVLLKFYSPENNENIIL